MDSKEITFTEGFNPDVAWEPFIDGPTVGFRVTRLSDGAKCTVRLAPSTDGDGECTPDVFLYNDPGDMADPFITECWIEPRFGDEGPK